MRDVRNSTNSRVNGRTMESSVSDQSSTSAPVKEYATGARVHTSRIGLEREDKTHWKIAFFIVLSFVPVFIGAIVWLALSVPKTEVFAIQKDSVGNIVPLGPVTILDPPNLQQRKVALTRWFQDLYITTDELSQKHLIDRVYGMVASGSAAEGAVDNIYRNPQFDPRELRKNHQHLTITIPGIDSTTDTDFKTDYIVRRYNRDNSLDVTFKRHATLKVVFDSSVDTGSLWVNPSRIFITELNDEPQGG
jgi:type IV secretory pathway TrbF-like protein